MSILTQDFVFDALKAERNGSQFPIDFDNAWVELGYSTKGNAKRALQKGLTEAEDFIIYDKPDNHKGFSVQKLGAKAVTEKIFLTVDGFKHFCLMARTEQGRQTRRYFIETEKAYRAQLERLLLATPREADNTRYTITCWKVHQDSGIKDPYYVRDVIVDNYDHKIVNQIVCVTRLVYEDLMENFRSTDGADISELPPEKRRKFHKTEGKKNKREPQSDNEQLSFF